MTEPAREPDGILAPISPGMTKPGGPGLAKHLPKYAQDTDRPYEGDPWQRQKEESDRSFVAFSIYRDMDPAERSIAAAERIYAERSGLSPNSRGRLAKWSVTHRWEERVQMYDTHQDALLRRRLERRRLKAAEKHADQIADSLEVLSRPAQLLAKRMREQLAANGVTFMDDASDADLLKLVKAFRGDLPALQKAEREALGSVTGPSGEPAKVKAAGSTLRMVLANKELLGIVERTQLEISAEGVAEDD